jgi:hypothetical protein
MCMRVSCQDCGKPTYAGCGRHVDQVLGDVPVRERCQCRDGDDEPGERSSWASRLFGR